MKKHYPTIILTALALTLGLSASAAAAGPGSTAPDDLNAYLLAHTTVSDGGRSLPIDRSEVNEHAITGYYTYTFQEGKTAGRSFKLYAGRHAALRSYITVIAVPDGTADTYDFLEKQGWLKQADTYGELLFVLEPENGSWKTPDDEAAYLDACLGESVATLPSVPVKQVPAASSRAEGFRSATVHPALSSPDIPVTIMSVMAKAALSSSPGPPIILSMS
ncbi:hypothetical protein V3C10_02620 [[Clostridium] symbiosum]|uniref:hypothetical protein n=1 Tax=Clostridium symbiosum TaxID=1512 RepID=UPI001D06167C|nr:hypothetical protein [[Clostridium] symbiosum]MCB6608486.1 hypothetical protein [[Clostridium] symbiosum]MCB6932202.1 hypothetical protein [[Clostridium] symbiosum]